MCSYLFQGIDAVGVLLLQLGHLQRLCSIHQRVQDAGGIIHPEARQRRHLVRQEVAQRHLRNCG